MVRYGMVIDLDRCIGCYSCLMACKDEYWGNDWPPYSRAQPDRGQQWIRIVEKEREFPRITIKVAYMPVMCMHCDDAPCIDSCPLGAIYRRDDGIVMIDPEKCDSTKCNGECIKSCPYGAISMNDELKIAQKCTMCAHLLDEGDGRLPRCVEACPTGAMIFGDLDDPDSDLSKVYKKASELSPDRLKDLLLPGAPNGIGPAVRYLGLPKPIIGGSVILSDTDECAGDVDVAVVDKASGDIMVQTKTNAFGDFMMEVDYGGTYMVKVEYDGYETEEFEVEVEGDVDLGEIHMSRTHK